MKKPWLYKEATYIYIYILVWICKLGFVGCWCMARWLAHASFSTLAQPSHFDFYTVLFFDWVSPWMVACETSASCSVLPNTACFLSLGTLVSSSCNTADSGPMGDSPYWISREKTLDITDRVILHDAAVNIKCFAYSYHFIILYHFVQRGLSNRPLWKFFVLNI